MTDFDFETDPAQVLEDVENAELTEAYEKELAIYRRNQVVLTVLRQVDAEKIPHLSDESRKNIQKYIRYLRVLDHLDDNHTMGKRKNTI